MSYVCSAPGSYGDTAAVGKLQNQPGEPADNRVNRTEIFTGHILPQNQKKLNILFKEN